MANVSGESGGTRLYSIGAVARMLGFPPRRSATGRSATRRSSRSGARGTSGCTRATRWTTCASSRQRFRAGSPRPTLTGCSPNSAKGQPARSDGQACEHAPAGVLADAICGGGTGAVLPAHRGVRRELGVRGRRSRGTLAREPAAARDRGADDLRRSGRGPVRSPEASTTLRPCSPSPSWRLETRRWPRARTPFCRSR